MRHLWIAVGLLAAVSISTARAAEVTLLDTGGFEGYALGDIVGQDGWAAAGGMNGGTPDVHPVIADVAGAGKALCFDNIQKTEAPIEKIIGNVTGTHQFAFVQFDYLREDAGIYNNLWWWPTGSNGFYGLAWDNAANSPAKILPFGFDSVQANQTPDQWMNIKLEWDLVNGKGRSYINNVLVDAAVNVGTGEFTGWFFDDEQTVDEGRTPGAVGRRAYVDNLRIVGSDRSLIDGAAIPEPGTLALLAGGVLPLLGLRRRKSA